MPAVCRVGDIGHGTCPNHSSPQEYTTVFISGAGDVDSNNSPNCFVGTIGVSTCGHNTIAISGSSNSTADGFGLHRVGDIGVNYGTYVAISGSSDVTSE